MKIYTKTGDKGTTSLLGGSRVSKHHLRIESYGTVDELNAWVGKLRDSLELKDLIKELVVIQDRLFTIGSTLATEPEKKKKFQLPEIEQKDIEMLEKAIDQMDGELPPMKNFILPGGHPAVSNAHVTRTICRKAERRVIELSENSPAPELIQPYLNRLSDYFFVLSRYIAQKLNAEEVPWKPAK